MSRAYQLDALKRIGLAVSELGCIMLDVAMPDISEAIPPAWAYSSEDPAHWWITGVQTEGHVTLLYGLLPDLVDALAVDEVLADWELPTVESSGLDIFPSPFPDEPYACIVARVGSPELGDAHARLSLLPHINTYPEYKAHVTLAYVHRDYAAKAVAAITHIMGGQLRFTALGLNYGHQIGRTHGHAAHR